MQSFTQQHSAALEHSFLFAETYLKGESPKCSDARCCEVLFREKSEYYSRENINSDPSCELSCHIGHIWRKCIFESLVNFMRNLCFRNISNPENNRQTAVRLTEKFLGFSVITNKVWIGSKRSQTTRSKDFFVSQSALSIWIMFYEKNEFEACFMLIQIHWILGAQVTQQI